MLERREETQPWRAEEVECEGSIVGCVPSSSVCLIAVSSQPSITCPSHGRELFTRQFDRGSAE
jgi:hypothetical protein